LDYRQSQQQHDADVSPVKRGKRRKPSLAAFAAPGALPKHSRVQNSHEWRGPLAEPVFGPIKKGSRFVDLLCNGHQKGEESVRAWLAQPGPALLHVKVKPMQLVMPPSPFVSPDAVVGMAVYTARAMLHGKGHDVGK
jgi:hypothetical protein